MKNQKITDAIILIEELIDIYNELGLCNTSLMYERQYLENLEKEFPSTLNFY